MGGNVGGKALGPKRGIGEQIFAEVESLTADGRVKRTAAFREIATRSGRDPGTVAANYYRIAHTRGVALRPRRPRMGRAVGGGQRGGGIDAAMQTIASALRAQEQELADLRQEAARFDKLRRILGK